MRRLLVALLILSSNAGATGLNGTRWIEPKGIECRYAIEFTAVTYSVFNDCYGPAETALVETGKYIEKDGALHLTLGSQYSNVSLFNMSDHLLAKFSLTSDMLVLSFGGNDYDFVAAISAH